MKTTTLFALLLIAFTVFSQTTTEIPDGWERFEDAEIGYEIAYPEGLIAEGKAGAFICGKEKGLFNAEYMMWITTSDNQERISMLFEDDIMPGAKVETTTVEINGIEAERVVLTYENEPDQYDESVLLKTDTHWFKFLNNGVKDPEFEKFYSSFKLLPKE